LSDTRRIVNMSRAIALATAAVLAASIAPPAHAWDSRTHRLITRLAVDALPAGSPRATLAANEARLQEASIAPDEVLRPLYGKSEAIKHYLDLEYYGADPFAALNPDIHVMEREYGWRTLEQSGTLPWTIEEESADLANAWRGGDCANAIQTAGYLAHYVGDATQPLHSTTHFDGYAQDRGVHRRFESAVDYNVWRIEQMARPEVQLAPIASPWDAAIAELRESHPLVQAVINADRAARAETGLRRGAYFDRVLMAEEAPMVARQIAIAASTLGSIWRYEWTQAGQPSACAQ
jgi:hypothetical protein